MKEAKLPRHKVFLVFTDRPYMEFHSLADWPLLYTWLGLSLPKDPWEKLLAFFAIIIVWPLALGDMLR